MTLVLYIDVHGLYIYICIYVSVCVNTLMYLIISGTAPPSGHQVIREMAGSSYFFWSNSGYANRLGLITCDVWKDHPLLSNLEDHAGPLTGSLLSLSSYLAPIYSE